MSVSKNTETIQSINLKVKREIYDMEHMASIPYNSMEDLGIDGVDAMNNDQLIEIIGKRRTIATVRGDSSFNGERTITIGDSIMENAGVDIGSTLTVRKINSSVVHAEKVMLTPLEPPSRLPSWIVKPYDFYSQHHIAKALRIANIFKKYPIFTKGDNIVVSLSDYWRVDFSGNSRLKLRFKVIDAFPTGDAFSITKDTVFEVIGDDGRSLKTSDTEDIAKLKVLEIGLGQVGRGFARFDFDVMDFLGIGIGDIIEIKGKRKTVARCLNAERYDDGVKGIIRIDASTRENAGIDRKDMVTIKKIEAAPAEKVIVAPLDDIPQIDKRYLAQALEKVPIIKGDRVIVPYYGGRLSFRVVDSTPGDAVIITRKTVFDIVESGGVCRILPRYVDDDMLEKLRKNLEKERLISLQDWIGWIQ